MGRAQNLDAKDLHHPRRWKLTRYLVDFTILSEYEGCKIYDALRDLVNGNAFKSATGIIN